MTTKKEGVKIFPKLFDFLSDLTVFLKSKSTFEFEKFKQKIMQYSVIYGLFIVAVLFVLIGIVKYLAEIYVFSSEGIGFIIVGCAMIVVLAAYSMIKRI